MGIERLQTPNLEETFTEWVESTWTSGRISDQ